MNAVTGSNEFKISKRRKQGYLTKVMHAEIALGINNATMKKKTLVLMSLSIAISIILFLGFNVFISFMYSLLKLTKPYTPDITIVCRNGLGKEYIDQFADGRIKDLYQDNPTMLEATFNVSRLTEHYMERRRVL